MSVVMSRGFSPEIQKWIFASEGGYVDHPKDPGGATNLGITFKVLQAWRGTKITKADVKGLSKQEAALIYEKNYWNAVRGNSLPLGLDYVVFDFAVNSGVSRAIKDLQRAVRKFYSGVVDGVFGVQSMVAVKQFCDTYGTGTLIEAVCDLRWAFVKSLKTFETFGKGWQRRIWGAQMGVQVSDVGVADRGTLLASLVPAVQIKAPVEATPGMAYPEKTDVVDDLKDPGILAGVAGLVTSVVGAVADQPVLQVALIVAVGFLVYRFVITKQKVDPA